MTHSPLTVYIDFKSPYAYIAKDPTYALEAEFGIEINWLPLTLNIASFLGSAKKNNAGKLVENHRSDRQWAAVKYAYYDARRYASLRGLTLKGTQKIWDSSIAAIGMLWIKSQSEGSREVLKRYIDLVYERFWKRELDIEDVEVIKAVLKEAGASVSGFEDYLSGEGRRNHDDLQDEVLEKGYFGVPTYVIDDQFYFGREHLPRIRWHLSGRTGSPPDVGNHSILPSDQIVTQPVQGDDLTVCMDFKNIESYLALAPTVEMQSACGATINWLPLTSGFKGLSNESRMPDTTDTSEDFRIRRQRVRDHYTQMNHLRYAKLLDLTGEDIQRNCDSTMASLGLMWLKQTDESLVVDYIREVFEAFFRRHLDIEKYSVISQLLESVGGEVTGFDRFVEVEGKTLLDTVQQELSETGVFTAPAYIIDGEKFLGRQHLPLIEWYLRGQQGTAPV